MSSHKPGPWCSRRARFLSWPYQTVARCPDLVGYRRDAATARQPLEDPDRQDELLESDVVDTYLAQHSMACATSTPLLLTLSEAVIHTIC